MSVRSGLRGLERLARPLPAGVDLYQLRPDGRVLLADRDGARELGPDSAHGEAGEELLRFIDEGQFAHYLVGDAKTSPERPSNATYKLGIVAPHSAFTPHAHGGEHLVLSLGPASCGLYDEERRRVVDVPLTPGLLIRIPELMPHSFANRGAARLSILAANTGFGIDHEDYAITAAEAERRQDVRLAAALREVERSRLPGTVTPRERLAARLRRFAATLETAR
ncbi:cupin domain-containing protein [Kitasatospora sp. CM 4170]|uniref:Cupin domain-containing protein n=1 Tax=Kitasatospora aburaviensis TaxID=67265 RepID=A0ABW1EVX9_9ACTN|nr:cupin domain-containing protein [Kitasatospora sp. CM 4170]WNM43985.1 cupin domain-containing protein [Kitasatospora sp. CM 4170]